MSKLLNRTSGSESGSDSRFFSPSTLGSLVAVALSGYLLWQNRVRIQGFLSSMPSMMGGERKSKPSSDIKAGHSMRDTSFTSSAAI